MTNCTQNVPNMDSSEPLLAKRKLRNFTAITVAVEAKCDERTVQLVWKGAPITTMARERAYSVLVRRKLIAPREGEPS